MYVYVKRLSAVNTQNTKHEEMRHFFSQIVRFVFVVGMMKIERLCFYICVVFLLWQIVSSVFYFLFFISHNTFFKSSHKIALAGAAKALWVDISSRQIAQKSQFIVATGTFVLSISAKVDAGLAAFFASWSFKCWYFANAA